ncbi:hypothetical protein ACLB2K_051985 [Fragaria x ananassa]
MAAEKWLMVVVDGTAAMGPSLLEIHSLRLPRKDHQDASAGVAVYLGLVQYNSHGLCNSGCLMQASPWTRNVEGFLGWLSALHFSGGGGSHDAAIAEGLAEALVMFPKPTPTATGTISGTETGTGSETDRVQDHNARERHCILVAASNPMLIPTYVQVPWISNGQFSPGTKTRMALADAQDVAKLYAEGKNDPESEGKVSSFRNVKYPHFLVLLSNKFPERYIGDPEEPPFFSDANCPGLLLLLSKEFREAHDALVQYAGVNTLPAPAITAFDDIFSEMFDDNDHCAENIPSETSEMFPDAEYVSLLQALFPSFSGEITSGSLALDASNTCSPSTMQTELHSPQHAQEILTTPDISGAHQHQGSTVEASSPQTTTTSDTSATTSGDSRVPRASSRTRRSQKNMGLFQPRRSPRLSSRATVEQGHKGDVGQFGEPPSAQTSLFARTRPARKGSKPLPAASYVLAFFLSFQGTMLAKLEGRFVLVSKAQRIYCHVPLSGVSSWATLVVKLHGYAGLRSKIKECRGIRAVPLEFRHADPVEFGELVAGRGLNAEEGTRPSLHKLVGVWSRSPDEPKAGRNQSLPRLIRLAPWHGSAAWAKCGGRRARPVTNGIRAASAIVVRWSPSAHACRRVPRVESPWGRGQVGRVPQSRVRGRTPCFGGGECHVPLSGVSSWATLVVKLHGYAGLRSKIKECRGIRAVPLEFRQADPVEFGELVAGRGLNAEEGTRPSIHKLVGVWSRSPDEPKAGRNQSLPRLIRLAPWHGSAAWAKCGGRRARPVTICSIF